MWLGIGFGTAGHSVINYPIKNTIFTLYSTRLHQFKQNFAEKKKNLLVSRRAIDFLKLPKGSMIAAKSEIAWNRRDIIAKVSANQCTETCRD